MYYPSSQPSSAYDEGSPESLRKTSPVNFNRSLPPQKRIIDLETRAIHGGNPLSGPAGAVFDPIKSDYYGNVVEGYGINPAAGQFMRSPHAEYYPMEGGFGLPPTHPTQMTGGMLGFPKDDDTPGDMSGDSGRGYDYTSPHSAAHLGGHPPPSLMPMMRTDAAYTPLEESFGKVSGAAVIPHVGIPPQQQQQHAPSSASSTNSTTNNGGKTGSAGNRMQGGGSGTGSANNAGSNAIIYPWMKRVHSKGMYTLLLLYINIYNKYYFMLSVV